MDRQAVYDEYERARRTFHQLLDPASEENLVRPSDGTKWTNGQLLWHVGSGRSRRHSCGHKWRRPAGWVRGG
ncbi:DinB family protein [Streptomyces sp. AP-93]|uniref:DinB family protein n=1 Tax=Streptomyces sp. AP-93 TaxID=2929048 RepID=UPI001FAED6BD|nr:DinB family protein [Streptomyces sp. AP-93]MCJ0872710.1 DinB family protein [Streptomyces sp. AP-93]